MLKNLVDQTILATEDIMTDGEMTDWDPMKVSYEQKNFNSYQEQKFDANPLEMHVPMQGESKISPTKGATNQVRLYISNIPMSLTEDGMQNLFSAVGKCRDLKRCKPKESNGQTTFGFVTYDNVRDAEKAIEKYNGFKFGGKYTLRVRLATAKVQTFEQHFNQNISEGGEKMIWGGNKEYNSDGDASNGSKNTSSSGAVEVQQILEKKNENSTHTLNKPRLYIQGLPTNISDIELEQIFSKVGHASNGCLVPPSKPNQYTTFGFKRLPVKSRTTE